MSKRSWLGGTLCGLLMGGLVGCGDDPAQMKWTVGLTYQTRACSTDDSAEFFLWEHTDGTYGTQILEADGTRFQVDDSTGRQIHITIIGSDQAFAQYFDRAEFDIERTPAADSGFPDDLVGSGFVDEGGSYPCRDEFTLEGIGLATDANCGRTPDEHVACADVSPYSW